MSTFQIYGKFPANLMGGEAGSDVGQMDLLTDALRWTLHTSSYTPNIDTHEAFADATNELSTANGYTANGIAAAGKTVVYNATGNVTTFSMDSTTVTWTASGAGLSFQYAILHDDTISTGPPIKPLIGYIDLGATTVAVADFYTLTLGASGLFAVTVS